MSEILLFHHAQGQTSGFFAFADDLRQAGHTVHTPDLYSGRTFDTLQEGIAHAQKLGFSTLLDAGVHSAEKLPDQLVYAGFSLGVMPAQKLAQTRPGAQGALFFHASLPTSEFSDAWPPNVPVQIHAMDQDPWFDEDRAAAEELVASAPDAELFLYPGSAHLFADRSLPDFDEQASAAVLRRVLSFLGRR